MVGEKNFVFVVLLMVLCGFAAKANAGVYFATDQISFIDLVENAAYESSFGLYAMDDPSQKYQVFGKNKEPGAIAYVTEDMWSYLDEGFGFYFDVYVGGKNDSVADYMWRDNALLNQYAAGPPIDTNVQHVNVQWSNHGLLASLDDQIGGGDRDFDDMKVIGVTCKLDIVTSSPAPVPEPATMLLLSTGLAGLAGLSRKKKNI